MPKASAAESRAIAWFKGAFYLILLLRFLREPLILSETTLSIEIPS